MASWKLVQTFTLTSQTWVNAIVSWGGAQPQLGEGWPPRRERITNHLSQRKPGVGWRNSSLPRPPIVPGLLQTLETLLLHEETNPQTCISAFPLCVQHKRQRKENSEGFRGELYQWGTQESKQNPPNGQAIEQVFLVQSLLRLIICGPPSPPDKLQSQLPNHAAKKMRDEESGVY